jgi:hypothetical protein
MSSVTVESFGPILCIRVTVAGAVDGRAAVWSLVGIENGAVCDFPVKFALHL